AVELGHVEIEQKHIERAVHGEIERRPPVARELRVVPSSAEQLLQPGNVELVVLPNEDAQSSQSPAGALRPVRQGAVHPADRLARRSAKERPRPAAPRGRPGLRTAARRWPELLRNSSDPSGI